MHPCLRAPGIGRGIGAVVSDFTLCVKATATAALSKYASFYWEIPVFMNVP
jgi:hypothetical protein